MDYADTVHHFVVENFLFGDAEWLKEDTSFLEKGIIDSTGVLELVFFLEETYKIKIEDDKLIPENLRQPHKNRPVSAEKVKWQSTS